MLREWTEISLVEIDSVTGDKEKSWFELCFQVFRDKSLDYFPLPFCDRIDDELLLTLCCEDRILMMSV